MENEPGGGASRSTDPASGSSAATDVSLREYIATQITAIDRHFTAEISALRRETETANSHADRAIIVAADEANERLQAHNGLIEQMRTNAEHFATREALDDHKEAEERRFGRLERFQSMLIGGMILLSTIGVANLVKVWTG